MRVRRRSQILLPGIHTDALREVVNVHHRPSAATHTVELAQLTEINQALRVGGGLRAADLRTATDPDEVGIEVPDGAVLTDLFWEGPPGYPYIHAHFRLDGHHEALVVDLHSAVLRELSHLLGLRHIWGV
jgi:hypothetical protein